MFDYIIPCANVGGPDYEDRINNIQRIIDELPHNIRIVIIEQRIDRSYTRFKDSIFSDGRTNFVEVYYPVFNKPWLYNIGVRNSRFDYIILGETDCLPEFPQTFFLELYKYIAINRLNWCHAWNRIKYYNADQSQVYRDDSPKRGGAEGGLVFFQKDYYWKIGGTNEWMYELGGMDNELIRRAEFRERSAQFNWTINHYWHRQNRMKMEDWKFAKYREQNRKIYKDVVNNPGNYIKIFNSFKNKLGDNYSPLSSKLKWENLHHDITT